MSSERTSLAAAVERMEALTAELGEPSLDLDRRRELADEALALSAEISERLPRIIREIEDAAGGQRTSAPPSVGENSE